MNRDTVQCFWCEPSDRAEETLRRFCYADATGTHYHDAENVLGEVPLPLDAPGGGLDDFDRTDPRWPRVCSCGYLFSDDDQWQHNIRRKYRRTDTGALYVLSDLPPGAMYDANWYPSGWKGADGLSLVVIGPARCGAWTVDGKSANGGGWQRTGDPRQPATLSCSPSIWWGQSAGGDREWHGYLTNGVLRPC